MEYVRNKADVDAVAAALSEAPLFAADTEAAGYHRYHDRICLLQISTRERTFIVDTLALTSLSELAAHFADRAKEVVLHDADYDLRLLARDYDIRVGGLFDTKLAAQLLGEPAFGLGALVEKYLGRKLDKKHQRADWAQRPLPSEMLEYAAEDTRHLPPLRDRLKEELSGRGRLHWAEEEFALREHTRWDIDEEVEGYLRVKHTRDLTPRQLAALRELHAWREGAAQRRDVATFRVLSNDLLTAAARALPGTAATVSAVAGMPASVAERYGQEMAAAVSRALALPERELPKRERGPRRPAPDAEFEEMVDKLKRARDAAATALDLDRGFLMPRQQLEATARLRPRELNDLLQVPDMRRWQIEALGERLLSALSA
ncbi:MAG TPA: HRDC domain-containing protein [Longimicrobiales bacterium]|nr:HRDC domain-containing protein [Longimicrobiales bacterium]